MTTALRSPPRGNGAVASAAGQRSFSINRGVTRAAHRVLIYGTGGIGKSSLAALRGNVVFADLEGGTADFDVARVTGLQDWADLRAWLQSDNFGDFEAVCIDTATTAEDWCRKWVIDNIKTDKGQTVTSIEGFGWGKGYTHMYEQWKLMLCDLERHYFAGRDVILLAHDRVGKVPNPKGDDYLRFEPRLLSNNQASLMYASKEWCDHVLYIGYDVVVDREGIARGSGSRSIYTVEEATHMAKGRGLPTQPVPFPAGDNSMWRIIRGTKSESNEPPPAE